MTALDQFTVVVVILFVVGIFSLVLTYLDLVGLSAIHGAFDGIQTYPAITQMVNNFGTLADFFPTLAVLMVITMIITSWMLSWFQKNHPLAAVVAIVFMVFYVMVSFFVSNEAVTVARLPIFSSVLSSANLLLLFFINMPVILFLATIVDIFIAVAAATGRIGPS